MKSFKKAACRNKDLTFIYNKIIRLSNSKKTLKLNLR